MFLMNYPSEEKDIPLKADSDPARYILYMYSIQYDVENLFHKQNITHTRAHTHTIRMLCVLCVLLSAPSVILIY